MSLLDFMNSDEARLGLGLLAAGGYQPAPMNFGQRIAGAFAGEDQRKADAMKTALLKAQIESEASKSEFERMKMPLLLSELQLKNDQHKALNSIVGGLLGSVGASASTSANGAPIAQSGAADGGASTVATQQQPSQDTFSTELRQVQALSLLDATKGRAQVEILKLKYPDLGEHQGMLFNKRTGQVIASMPFGTATGNVIQYQPQPGGGFAVTVPPGASQALAQATAIKTEAEEAAKSRYRLITTPPTSPDMPPVYRSEASVLGGAPAPTSSPSQQATAQLPPQYAALLAGRPPNQRAALEAALRADAAGLPTNVSETRGELAPRPSLGTIPTQAVTNAAGMSPTQAAEVKATEAATTEKYKEDAKRVGELEAKLPILSGTARRLRRLQDLTADDRTYAAAGAEIKTQLSSIAQGLGLKININKTANTEEYIAHVAELLKERLSSKDYGSGSAVSNVDLLAASKPLPEVMRTTQGRMQIIDALLKDTERGMAFSRAASSHFQKNRSLSGFDFTPPGAPDYGTQGKRSREEILRQYRLSP